MSKRRNKFGKILWLPGKPKDCTNKPLSKDCLRAQSYVPERVRTVVHTVRTKVNGALHTNTWTENEPIPFTPEEQAIKDSHSEIVCRECRYNLHTLLNSPFSIHEKRK